MLTFPVFFSIFVLCASCDQFVIPEKQEMQGAGNADRELQLPIAYEITGPGHSQSEMMFTNDAGSIVLFGRRERGDMRLGNPSGVKPCEVLGGECHYFSPILLPLIIGEYPLNSPTRLGSINATIEFQGPADQSLCKKFSLVVDGVDQVQQYVVCPTVGITEIRLMNAGRLERELTLKSMYGIR